jgi:hypothetical protein
VKELARTLSRPFINGLFDFYQGVAKLMQKLNTIKRVKLAVVAFIIMISFACLRSGQTAASQEQEQPRRPLEFVPASAPLETRAGTDDGAAFAIQFMGSTHGSLEPCG